MAYSIILPTCPTCGQATNGPVTHVEVAITCRIAVEDIRYLCESTGGKIEAIKALRERYLGLSLKDAKDLVEVYCVR